MNQEQQRIRAKVDTNVDEKDGFIEDDTISTSYVCFTSPSRNLTISHLGRTLLITTTEMSASLALPPNGKSRSCLDISESLDNGFHFCFGHACIERQKDHRVSRLF
jgi:hypothetical protein